MAEEKKEVTLDNVKFESEVVGSTVNLTTDKETYIQAAEEAGLDKKTLKTVSDFNGQYLKAAVKAATVAGGDALVANKDTDDAFVKIPFGLQSNEVMTANVIRERSVRNVATGEVSMKPGIKVKVKTRASGLSAGYIKSQREVLEDILAKG